MAEKAQVEAARRSSRPLVAPNRQPNINRGAAADARVRAGASYDYDASVRPRGGKPVILRNNAGRTPPTNTNPNFGAWRGQNPGVTRSPGVDVRRGGNRGGGTVRGGNRGGDTRVWTGNDNNVRVWQGGRRDRRDWQTPDRGQTRVWTGRHGGRRGDWHRRHHTRAWWRNNFTRFALFGGGYYYWDSGYWYPAYGYDPYFNTYVYDAPIYGYNDLEPSEVIARVQEELERRGYDPGVIDGQYGPATREALLDYQRDNGLPVTGEVDEATLDSMGLL